MPDAIWTRYEVRWQFTGRLCGSVPQRAELIKAWLDARAPERIPAAVAAGEAPTLADLEQEVIATLPDQPETDAEMVERITLGFQQNAAGLFVRGGTVKAHLKDCANQLQKPLDFKNLRSHVANAVYVAEDEIALGRAQHDGEFEQPVHAMTARGPRNSLKRIRTLDRPAITFHLQVLLARLQDQTHRKGEDVLRTILDYGSIHGYGGERGMGNGRYTWTLTEIEA